MDMAVPMGMIQAAVTSVRIPHEAQDGRRIRLQHINNNHPHATAKGSQVLCLRAAARANAPRRRRAGLARSADCAGGERTLTVRCRECC